MEQEYVEVDDFRSGRLESIVIDADGHGRKIVMYSSKGYPPKYTVLVDEHKLAENPFDQKETAHRAALDFIHRQTHGNQT